MGANKAEVLKYRLVLSITAVKGNKQKILDFHSTEAGSVEEAEELKREVQKNRGELL